MSTEMWAKKCAEQTAEIERLRHSYDCVSKLNHHRAKELERLRALVKWCRPRLKRDCYRDRVDAVLANPTLMDPDPEMAGTLIQSRS